MAEVKDYLQRMQAELAELNDRIEKLGVFMQDNPIFEGLDQVRKTLLTRQYNAMLMYSKCLQERVDMDAAASEEEGEQNG